MFVHILATIAVATVAVAVYSLCRLEDIDFEEQNTEVQ